jgi:hypothetical protein
VSLSILLHIFHDICSCEARDEVSVLANAELQKCCSQSGVIYVRGLDVHMELCSFALSTPGVMVVTVGLTFRVLICENKMNHFGLKAGKTPYFLFINFCQLRIKILNFLYFGFGSHILIVVFPCMLTIIQLLFQQNAHVFYY